MAILIGGHETGLANSSFSLLDRDDKTGKASLDKGSNAYINTANGNLILRHQDAFIPSMGEDFALFRTYNSRGRPNDTQHDDARWSLSTAIELKVKRDRGEKYFEVSYGDGSVFDYRFDQDTGRYVSTDGVGAFETIEDLNARGNDTVHFVLTRADQTQLKFDKHGNLVESIDTNGVKIEYRYHSNRLQTILDDDGHVINFIYQQGKLFRVVDETQTVLVEYRYHQGRLSEVIDRNGHKTQYFYTNDGFLNRVVMPERQVADGQLEQYARRELNFSYDYVNWKGDSRGRTPVIKTFTDAEGNTTTFDYAFNFSHGPHSAPQSTAPAQKGNNGKGNGKGNGNSNGNSGGSISGTGNSEYYQGGRTRVVDALGNRRAYSNAQDAVTWRLARGFYEYFDPHAERHQPAFQAQVEAIRDQHAMHYQYRDDGYLTEVRDQQGYVSRYDYDEQDNVVAITDANAWAVVNSDSAYYRGLRAELGVVNINGLGKLAANLTAAEKALLENAFTSRFDYDERGNLIKTVDNQGNVTTFTYTAFNKLASTTRAMGHALVTSDEAYYADKRESLGYARAVADLAAADIDALIELHTTHYHYDSRQNLIRLETAGDDIETYSYDQFGNLVERIVYPDSNDLSNQQVTRYTYDAFGNNIATTDAEGNQAFSEYDHFGNLIRYTDARGGESTFTYDNDDRLLSATDPEGNTVLYRYDAVGNRIAMTDARGQTSYQFFDRNNNLLSTVNPAVDDANRNRVENYRYDVVGNRIAVTDAEGRETRYVFNNKRQVVDIISPSVDNGSGQGPQNFTESFGYDALGNLIFLKDRNGNQTELTYDRNSLIRRETRADGHISEIAYDADGLQIRIVAGVQLPSGEQQVTEFVYDEEGQLILERDAEGGNELYSYSANGNVLSFTDKNGNKTDYVYDKNNRIIEEHRASVVNPQDGTPVRYVIRHEYDANGNKVKTTDGNGNSSETFFDKNDRTVMVRDGNDIATVFAYDENDNIVAVTIGADATFDATNASVSIQSLDEAQIQSFVYDEFNQLVATVDGMGHALAENEGQLYQQLRQQMGYSALAFDLTAAEKLAIIGQFTETYTYDRVGNQTRMVDNLGRITDTEFDSFNRVTKETQYVEVAGILEARSTQYAYDANDNIVAITDARGNTQRFEFDSRNREILKTDSLGRVTRREFDSFSNLLSVTLGDGSTEAATTRFEYDRLNRAVLAANPNGDTVAYTYDAVGNRILVTDSRGNDTRYVFDALNRNIEVIDRNTFTTRYAYDGADNLIRITDPRDGVTQIEYDAGNRQIRLVDAENRVTQLEYDVRGNTIKQITGAGTSGSGSLGEAITEYRYDAENNLRQVIDAEGNDLRSIGYDRVYNITEQTDANGNSTRIDFDALNRQVLITDGMGGVVAYAYDEVGNVLSITNENGAVSHFEYDAENQITKQIDAFGVETHLGYDAIGNQTLVIEAANSADARETLYRYDLDGRLLSLRDALGQETTYDYDGNGNIIASTDANGNTTSYLYDAEDQLLAIVDPEGGETRYTYDGNGNRTVITDANGNSTVRYFNANNELVLEVDPKGHAQTYEYDAKGNVIAKTAYALALSLPVDPQADPASLNLVAGSGDQRSSYRYDLLNRLVESQDPAGGVTTMTYDGVGNKISETDPNGNRTLFFYDANDRLTQTTNALGDSRIYGYDAVGNLVSLSDELGREIQYRYDVLNRLVETTDALNQSASMSYDAVGNKIAETDRNGGVTRYDYDAANRVIAIINANGHDLATSDSAIAIAARADLGIVNDQGEGKLVADLEASDLELITAAHQSSYSYDGVGNILTKTNELGEVTRHSYDGNNRLISTEDDLGQTVSYEYDAFGNQLAMIDIRGNRFEFGYDVRNQLVSKISAEGNSELMEYDAFGNLILESDGSGVNSTFAYDLNNRLVQSTLGDTISQQFEYDAAGNLLRSVDPNTNEFVYQYDALNRVVSETRPIDGATTGTRSSVFDAVGNRIAFTDANGNTVYSSFDANNRLIAELSPGGFLVQYTYDANGNLLRVESFNDRYSLNADGTLPAPNAGDVPQVVEYQYDARNQRLTESDTSSLTVNFEHDLEGKLVTGSVNPKVRMKHDRAGRVVETTDALGIVTRLEYDGKNVEKRIEAYGTDAARTTTYEYDRDNRLKAETSAVGHALISSDSDDHRAQRARLGFVDGSGEGKLVADLSNGEIDDILALYTTRYKYDRADRLVEKTYSDGSGQRTETFEYERKTGRLLAQVDGNGVRTEFEYDASGNQTRILVAPGTTAEREETFSWSSDNQLIEENRFVNGAWITTQHRYDNEGNKIETIQAVGEASERHTLFRYDGDDQPSAIVAPEGWARANSDDAIYQSWRSDNGYSAAAAGLSDADVEAILATMTTEYEYDLDGNQTRIVDPDGTVTVNTFIEGRLATNLVGANLGDAGILTTNTYDVRGNLTSTTISFADGSDARTTIYEYDLDNRLVALTDPEDFTTTYEYDAFDNQTAVIVGQYLVASNDVDYDATKAAVAQPQTTTYEYDEQNRLLLSTDSLGNGVRHFYDALGNRIETQSGLATAPGSSPEHLTIDTYEYNLGGQVTAKRSSAGGVTLITYDAQGRQSVIETLQSGTENSGVWITETLEKDEAGRVIASTDDNGIRTEFEFDAIGNVIAKTFDAGGSAERRVEYEYDFNDKLISETDPMGNRKLYSYDDAGNRVSEQDGEGNVRYFYYDAFNQLIATVDGELNMSTIAYDSAGNVIETRVYANALASQPDVNTLPVLATSSLDQVVTQVFDGNNKRISETFGDGSQTVYQYNSTQQLIQQNKVASTDAEQLARTGDTSDIVLAWTYDAAGRLSSFTSADGSVETYTYDAAGNKLSESLSNPNSLADGRSDPTRTTTFTYDAANRMVSQNTGGETQYLAYDKVGNTVSKTDGNGNVTLSEYDLQNRVTKVTNALNEEISYTYDAVGNLVTTTNAEGHTFTQVYDLNNRVIEVIEPAVDIYDVDSQITLAHTPITKYTFDANGNTISQTDPNGNVTSRWFDANDRLIAEVSGDLVLREFAYTAGGNLASTTVYAERLPNVAASRDPDVIPTVAGDSMTVTNVFDNMGRVIRTEYPDIEVTNVVNIQSTNASATSSTTSIDEENYFDAFGRIAESVDRNGNTTYAFYDKLDRQIALIDPDGFLIESEFDAMGNLVQQRKFTAALGSPGTYQPGSMSNNNNYYAVDRIYDDKGRLIEEVSPEIETFGNNERVSTEFTYDANGNLIERVIAAGTAQAQTETYFYDAADRRVGTVIANGVVNTFSYDKNGNLTELKRYIDTVSTAEISQAGGDLATLISQSVSNNSAVDQTTQFSYDAGNRLITETDLMDSGTSDDLIVSYRYDAKGNQTHKTDELGNVSETKYDAADRVSLTITPNGAYSYVEYNTSGLKTRSWTSGAAGVSAPLPTESSINVSAVGGSQTSVTIGWDVQRQTGLSTWVVWDTQSHTGNANVDSAYANTTSGGQYSGSGDAHSVSLVPTGVNAGETVYFRVITRDSANNVGYSEERSFTLPTVLNTIDVAQSSSNATVTLGFNGAVSDLKLVSSSLSSPLSFSGTSGNEYEVSLAMTSSLQSGSYQFQWTANGQTYTSAAFNLFKAADDHVETNGILIWSVPTDGSNLVSNSQIIITDGEVEDSANAYRAGDNLQYTPAAGNHQYDVLYGDELGTSDSLAITVQDTQKKVANVFQEIEDDDGKVVEKIWFVSWESDNNGLVSTQFDVSLASTGHDIGSSGVKVAYRLAQDGVEFSNEANLSLSGGTYSANLNLSAEATYDVKVYYINSSGEEVIVEWQRITLPSESPAQFIETVRLDADETPDTSATQTVTVMAQTTYDDVATLTVKASETGGQVNGTIGSRTVTEGLYSGPVDPNASTLSVAVGSTSGSTAGTRGADGLTDLSYFTEIVYNELGYKVATNEDSGLWRILGVDANGNVVSETMLGSENASGVSLDASLVESFNVNDPNETVIRSFFEFDGRNFETRKVMEEISGSSSTFISQYQRSYDFDGRVSSETAAGGTQAKTYTYDGVGNLASENNGLATANYYYDLLGNMVRRSDYEGHTQVFEYTYSGTSAGYLTGEYVVGLENEKTTHSYDAFGRRTASTNGASETQSRSYDQRDRLVSLTDPMGGVTNYTYDGRNRQTWVEDANGNFFGRAYDAMGNVTNEYSFQTQINGVNYSGFAPTSAAAAQNFVNADFFTLVNEETQYDIYGNEIKTIDAAGREDTMVYGAFGRLLQTDTTSFEYDRFGQISVERNSFQGNTGYITRSYDYRGNLLSVTDHTTGASTAYAYYDSGERKTEVLTISGTIYRNQTYTYDSLNRMTQWVDAASGLTTNYTYYANDNVKSISHATTTASYTYDNANRIKTFADNRNGSVTTYTYGYDNAGRRSSQVTTGASASAVYYTYDDNSRILRATYDYGSNSGDGDDSYYAWTYDSVGNSTSASQYTSGSRVEYKTSTYDTNYRVYQTYETTDDGNQTIYNTLDISGRNTQTRIVSVADGDTTTLVYNNTYDDETGLQTSVSGQQQKDKAPVTNSSLTYNVNGELTQANLGRPEDTDDVDYSRDEINNFLYDNDGHIVYASRDEGEKNGGAVVTRYLYANGKAVGEYESANSATINAGNYAVIKVITPGFDDGVSAYPSGAIQMHTVAAGDSLRSLATSYFGNPDMWFVIAEANGLNGDVALQNGQRLIIPNTVENGRFTDKAFAPYDESEIIGSKMPNIQNPPPPKKDKCAVITAIILIVVVAIVAIALTIVSVGTLAPAAAAALGFAAGGVAAVLTTVAVGAVVGAAIAFAASAATQGILVGFKLQDKFDWNAVAADTAAGGLAGAAAGLGAAFNAARAASTAFKVVNVVGQVALEVAGELTSQAIQYNGEIKQPWLVAVAGAGGAVGAIADVASRGAKLAGKVDDVIDVADDAAKSVDEVAAAARSAGKQVFDRKVFAAVAKHQWAQPGFIAELKSGYNKAKKGVAKLYSKLPSKAQVNAGFTKASDAIGTGLSKAGTGIKSGFNKAGNAIGRGLGAAGDGLVTFGRGVYNVGEESVGVGREIATFGGDITKQAYGMTSSTVTRAFTKGIDGAKYVGKGGVSVASRIVDDTADFQRGAFDLAGNILNRGSEAGARFQSTGLDFVNEGINRSKQLFADTASFIGNQPTRLKQAGATAAVIGGAILAAPIAAIGASSAAAVAAVSVLGNVVAKVGSAVAGGVVAGGALIARGVAIGVGGGAAILAGGIAALGSAAAGTLGAIGAGLGGGVITATAGVVTSAAVVTGTALTFAYKGMKSAAKAASEANAARKAAKAAKKAAKDPNEVKPGKLDKLKAALISAGHSIADGFTRTFTRDNAKKALAATRKFLLGKDTKGHYKRVERVAKVLKYTLNAIEEFAIRSPAGSEKSDHLQSLYGISGGHRKAKVGKSTFYSPLMLIASPLISLGKKWISGDNSKTRELDSAPEMMILNQLRNEDSAAIVSWERDKAALMKTLENQRESVKSDSLMAANPGVENQDARTQVSAARGDRSRWAPMTWKTGALGASSQIFSQFGIDNSVSFAQALAENKLSSGQLAGFSRRDSLTHLERVAGKVGGVASYQPQPIQLLDNSVKKPA